MRAYVKDILMLSVSTAIALSGCSSNSTEQTSDESINHIPIAEDIIEQNGIEDTPVEIVLKGSDPDGDILTYNITTQPQHGEVQLNGNKVQYTPYANYNGMDTFTYQSCDSSLCSNNAQVTITLAPVNDKPEVFPLSFEMNENDTLSIELKGVDVDGDTLSFAISGSPKHGTFLNGIYTPDENFVGTDYFTYLAYDGEEYSEQATVTIHVLSTNQAPTLELSMKKPYFIEHNLSTPTRAYAAFPVDLDGDSDMDVVIGTDGQGLFWYENIDQEFVEHNLSSDDVSTFTVSADDMDMDGDMDVLTADTNGTVYWYENNNQNFTRHTIDNNQSDTPFFVKSIDFDYDDDKDVVVSGDNDINITIYENNSSGYVKHNISTIRAEQVNVSDLDKDGDYDIVLGDWYGDRVLWLEQTSDYTFEEHTIDTNQDGPRFSYTKDLDNDGDIDIVTSASAWHNDSNLTWYENDGAMNFTRHIVSQHFNNLIDTGIVDLDKDGDYDLLASSHDDHKVAWFENNGEHNFTEHVISLDINGSWEVHYADMDSDGDIDLIATETNDNYLFLFEQKQGYVVLENNQTVMTITASDADGDTLTFSIDGIDSTLFDINETSGLLTFKNAPDYENPLDSNGDNVYEITIKVTDGKESDSQDIVVAVEDVQDES